MKKRKATAILMAAVMATGVFSVIGTPVTAKADEDPVTVKWLMFGDKPEDYDMVMEELNQKIKEKINVELDLEIIPQGEYNDKVKLALTAGEDFDLVFTASWINNFTENMTRDAFLPLDELLETYGQDMKEAIPDWLMTVGKVNGQQYAIPNQQIIARQLGLGIQKSYADKYGFDLTSFDDMSDLYPFLDQVAANETDKFAIDYFLYATVENKYENIVDDYVFIDKNDPEATLLPCTEVYAEEFKLDNELFQKGYIRKDIATVVDRNADITAGRYVTLLGTYKPGLDTQYSQRLGTEMLAIPMGEAYINANSGSEAMTAINVNSKHPEEAMKLLNLVYTDKEIYNELLYGIEDVHYTKTGDNRVELIDGNKYNTVFSTYGWKFGNQFNQYLVPGQADDLWEETAKMNNEAPVSVLRGFVFDPSNVQTELTQLAAVKDEFKNGQYTTADIEKFITDRNEKMEQAGLSTLMEEVQRQVDEWKAANGK